MNGDIAIEKILWKENKYRNIVWKKTITLTMTGIIIAYSIAIFISFKEPSPINLYLFIWISLALLISLFFGYFIDKYIVLKSSPKEVGFSRGGIHFKYLDREDFIKWDNIRNIKKDFSYPLMVWKIYQNKNRKMDLATCDGDIIYEIQKQFKKYNEQKKD